jgi:tRNA A-37 threonylcarbamoyl transferase component Bud32
MSEPANCPDASELDAYARGELAGDLRTSIDAHLDACDDCRRVVSALVGSALADPLGPTYESVPAAAAAAEPAALAPGQLLLGKYEVETLIGAGGMGIVARARHRFLDRAVVIKLLRTAQTSPESVRRFLREARAAAAIDNRHVVRVIDAGMLDAARPYLVLEHLEGRDLAQELSERGALEPSEAIEIALQCAEALAAAHARGIVHRDIKPANLFLIREADGRPLVKVLDFGIAKALHDSELATQDGSLTESAAVIGSPRYMSPEQLRDSGDVDVRTDIWSLGAVLHELVSGRAACDGPNLAVITAKILTQPPAPLGDAALGDAALGRVLGRVLDRCLDKDRNARFGSALELARALAPLSAADESARLERMQGAGTGDTLRSGPAPVAEWGGTRRRRLLFALAVAASLSLMALGGFWLSRAAEDPPSIAPAATPPPVEPARTAGLPGATAGLPGATAGLPGATAGLPGATAGLPGATAGLTVEAAPPASAAPGAAGRARHFPRNHSPPAGASATGVTPAPSGVDVQSDGLRDRK